MIENKDKKGLPAMKLIFRESLEVEIESLQQVLCLVADLSFSQKKVIAANLKITDSQFSKYLHETEGAKFPLSLLPDFIKETKNIAPIVFLIEYSSLKEEIKKWIKEEEVKDATV